MKSIEDTLKIIQDIIKKFPGDLEIALIGGYADEKEKTLELAKRIGRDKKLHGFLSQLREEPAEDLPEELI